MVVLRRGQVAFLFLLNDSLRLKSPVNRQGVLLALSLLNSNYYSPVRASRYSTTHRSFETPTPTAEQSDCLVGSGVKRWACVSCKPVLCTHTNAPSPSEIILVPFNT